MQSNKAHLPPLQTLDLEFEIVNEEIVFVVVSTGFGDLAHAGYGPGDEVGRISIPLSHLRRLLAPGSVPSGMG
jgi:hypothetical protein